MVSLSAFYEFGGLLTFLVFSQVPILFQMETFMYDPALLTHS